ncbi:MAG TPA: hypothetical protein VFV38_48335, partial [Ktedonobacteraceae bacterium]|nr:hypothetical protein [Ktedonobacteraceae bacterium]
MPENDVNPVVAEFVGDCQGRVLIQIRRVESLFDGRQWPPSQEFVEILSELAAIGMNVKQPGDPAEDMFIRVTPLNLRAHRLLPTREDVNGALLAPFATTHPDDQAPWAFRVRYHLAHIQIAQLLPTHPGGQAELDHMLPVGQVDLTVALGRQARALDILALAFRQFQFVGEGTIAKEEAQR